MNVRDYAITVDLKRPSYYENLKMRYNDENPLELIILDDGLAADLSAVVTTSLAVTRPDKATIVVEGLLAGNVASFKLSGIELQKPGRCSVTAQFYDAENRVSTVDFFITAIKDPTADGFEPSTEEKTLIETVLGDGPLVIADATQKVEELEQVIEENKFTFKGDVPTRSAIPSSKEFGDAWFVIDEGATVRWNGTALELRNTNNPSQIQNLTAQLAEKASQETVSDILTNETFAFGFDESGKMKSLYKDLINPFIFKLGLVLIGDSITWGMTTPGQASTSGRTGTYTDPKNVMTTNSWANLLHKYVAENFFKKTVLDGDNTTAGTIIYDKDYNLGFNKGYVTYSGEGTANGQVNVINQGGTLVGKLWYLYPLAWIEFHVTGDELDLYYTGTAGTPEYELFIDGVSQGKFSSNNPVAANKISRKHTFPYGTHTVRIAHGGLTSQVRLEGIRVNKKFIFKNAGNIGRSSDDWQKGLTNGLYDNAFSDYDRHTIIMLGTNDRTWDGWAEANSSDSTMRLLNNLVSSIQSDYPDIQIYMACANDVGEDESSKAFPMREVKDAVAMVAVTNELPFIDNYSATRKFDKSKILADGLHPNESGHLIVAKNYIGNLL